MAVETRWPQTHSRRDTQSGISFNGSCLSVWVLQGVVYKYHPNNIVEHWQQPMWLCQNVHVTVMTQDLRLSLYLRSIFEEDCTSKRSFWVSWSNWLLSLEEYVLGHRCTVTSWRHREKTASRSQRQKETIQLMFWPQSSRIQGETASCCCTHLMWVLCLTALANSHRHPTQHTKNNLPQLLIFTVNRTTFRVT